MKTPWTWSIISLAVVVSLLATATVYTTATSIPFQFIPLTVSHNSSPQDAPFPKPSRNPSTQASASIRDVVVASNAVPLRPGNVLSNHVYLPAISYVSLFAPPVDSSTATDFASATSFLYTGSNPVQTGVLTGTLTYTRVAVLRGRVLDRGGTPFSGATVSILSHPEYGNTATRADGLFDMAVNGGGMLTVVYQKPGYLTIQRQVEAPWRDYAWLPDIVMIPFDTAVTSINITATAMQVARGNMVSDTDGTRRATVLFPQGTTVTMVLADGTTQPLTTLNVRATEYTVGASGPQAMPASLPPSSGYTYATEFSADQAVAAGATEVRFSQAVIVYVENFRGLPVGAPVPTGYYDRKLGQWVASANGRVVKVLSITAGLADLDIDGTNNAASAPALSALGVTTAERAQLALLYIPGQALWRVPLTHFTPIDCNLPIGPPPGAKPPPGPNPAPPPKPNKPHKECGSVIGCEDQTLGESLPVAGTSWWLYYQSDRSSGRKDAYTLEFPVSGSTVPTSLQAMRVAVNIAGRLYQATYAPAPNITYTVTWDGKDAYGRLVQGTQTASIEVDFDYESQYYLTAEDFTNAFARAEAIGPAVSINVSTIRFTISKKWTENVGSWDARMLGMGGWSLNIQHAYDTSSHTLLLGDGNQRSATALTPIIATLAGDGNPNFSGDGGPAVSARMDTPTGVAVGPDGSWYVADFNNQRIRRVGPDGIISTFAGNGIQGFGGDAGPATAASLNFPYSIAVGPNGSLYIADEGNNRIRRVGTDGIITTVAGNGTPRYTGDSGLAVAASLSAPTGVAVGHDGSIYIADSNNFRIRRVGPDGIITTIAGNGNRGFSGDGGPAIAAQLNYGPYGLAAAPDGNLYIADSTNLRIRRVGSDGVITTTAGNGTATFSGDGGLAVDAGLYTPSSVAIGLDGSLFIADKGHNRIRHVGLDGVINTIAGSGLSNFGTYFGGDGGPAVAAELNNPSGIDMGPDGKLYIADTTNNRIRRVQSPLPDNSLSQLQVASEDGSELYVFSSSGRHLKTLDTLTGALRYQFGYNATGYLVSVTDGFSNVTTIERSGALPTAVVAPGGQRTTLTSGGDSLLHTVTYPAGEAYGLSYTTDGLLQNFVDPLAGVHHFTYDSLGRLIKDEDPVGGSTTLSRTEQSNGYTITTTSALGRSSVYQVELLITGTVRNSATDSSGARTVRLTNTDGSEQFSYADGTVTAVQYGPDPRWGMQTPQIISAVSSVPGRPIENMSGQHTAIVTDTSDVLSLQSLADTVIINGSTFTRNYDAATRTLTDISAEGRQMVYVLNGQGKIVHEDIAPGVASLLFTYDGQGRLIEDRQGAQVWTMTYDARNRIIRRTDATGQQIAYAYDADDRIITQTMPSGAVYQYTYDISGNRTQVILSNGAHHALQYTPLDLEASYTPPGNGGYLRSYNLDRQLTQTSLPGGRTLLQTYDTGGRVSGLSDLDAVTSFSYLSGDPTERAAHITQTPATGPGQDIAYGYLGSLVTAITLTGIAPAQITYTYDVNSFVAAMQFTSGPDSINTTITRDRDGLLTGFGPFIFTPGGPGGSLSRIGDGVMTTGYGYDALSRIITRTHLINNQSAYAMQLSYNTVGQMVSKTETVSGTTTFSYTYDLDGQLTKVIRNGIVSEQYTYDVNGNRTSQQFDGGPMTVATYDTQDRLTQLGTVTYQFNADGFLAQRGSDTFLYNVRGQLLQAIVAGQTITYTYDGLGRRVSRTDNTGTLQYLYGDASSQLVTAERGSTGEFTALYYDTAGLLIAMERGGTRYYVATDQAGSPRVVSNSSGAIVKVLEFDSFGRLLSDTNPAFVVPVGYAGGLADATTGLVHFGRRDYDTASGRWTARDPELFDAGQGNLYVYVGNSPISHRDPTGLICITVTLYDEIGGGVQTCFTSGGASICLEGGVGVGGGVSVDDSGLADNGGKIGVEGSIKCGPVALGLEASADTDGCLKGGPIGQIGPYKRKVGKNEIKPSIDGTPGYALDEKCAATAKLYLKVCHQEKL